jgi:DNA-binding HxlR family transcriptional regulator
MSDHAPIALCPRFHRAVELIGKRWTGAILRILQSGRTRFNAIAASIPDMSDRMLSERLRELEHEGIVERFVVPETPVRVEYELTAKGRALDEGVLRHRPLGGAVRRTDSGGDHRAQRDRLTTHCQRQARPPQTSQVAAGAQRLRPKAGEVGSATTSRAAIPGSSSSCPRRGRLRRR